MALKKLQNLQKNLKKFDNPKFISDLINKAIQRHEKELMLMNTENQIFKKGIRADGSRIKRKGASYPVYSEGYEKKKRKKGKYQGYVDLAWNKGYLNSFHILYLYQKIIIEAKDIILSRSFNLSDHLKEFYGDEIEGLTKQNLIEIAKVIKFTLLKLVKNELFKV